MSNLKRLIKRYFSSLVYFYRYLAYRLFIVIGLSILIGILDGFGLTMFLPLLQMADGSSTVRGEDLGDLKFLIDGINALGIELNIKTALLILFIFFSLKGVASYFALVYKVKVNEFLISTLRIKLTNLFTRYSFKSFVTSDIGRIQNSFTGEIQRVNNAYVNYSSCIQQLVLTLVYIFFVFMVNWKFALLVCLGGLITNTFYGGIYRNTKKQSLELSKNNSNYQGLIIQYIANFKYLKATGFLNNYAQKLKSSIKDIESNNKKIGILNARVLALREPMLIAVVCIVILIQVFIFKGELAPIMISLLFFYRALAALIASQQSYNNFLGVSGSLDNIAVFETELKQGLEKESNQEIKSFSEIIQVQNINFGYEEYNGILKNINLSIHKNQSVAFVGESGSGKTTLVNLISGLLSPNNGEIWIDNIPLSQLKIESFQSKIGYIAQEPVIFNDTIFANVTLWEEPNEKSKKQFEKAIKQASLSEFIRELPDKENTILGNNGINLSGGQKQRISIARELYKDINILILDEATSALDSETEKEIQDNIDALKGKYTTLIIAHRLSTIKNADVIYLMDKGKIIEQGSFDELIKSSIEFRKMLELQEI